MNDCAWSKSIFITFALQLQRQGGDADSASQLQVCRQVLVSNCVITTHRGAGKQIVCEHTCESSTESPDWREPLRAASMSWL
jgi:hypothetical protein